MHRYDHFYVGGCTLLRDQDYYPPQEEEELEAPSNQETLQDLLVSKCPRCQKVSFFCLLMHWPS